MKPPRKVILNLRPYYLEFLTFFEPLSTQLDDFQELIRQIVFELLNSPYQAVLPSVGTVIPQHHRMRDQTFSNDNSRVNQLTLATASLTATMIAELQMHGMFLWDFSLPYRPTDFTASTLVLEFLAD